MSSPYKVIWMDEALENVDGIVSYLDSQWSQKEVDAFLEKLRNREMLIAIHPKAFRLTGRKNVRASVLSSHITLFYTIESDPVHIRIQSVFDTRQDPDKLNPGDK